MSLQSHFFYMYCSQIKKLLPSVVQYQNQKFFSYLSPILTRIQIYISSSVDCMFYPRHQPWIKHARQTLDLSTANRAKPNPISLTQVKALHAVTSFEIFYSQPLAPLDYFGP